jgi:hypothetical protein
MEQKIQAAGERLVALRKKREARVRGGKPLPGYERNIVEIDAEIARLEALTLRATETKD